MNTDIAGILFICGPGEENLTIGNYVVEKSPDVYCEHGFSHARSTKVNI